MTGFLMHKKNSPHDCEGCFTKSSEPKAPNQELSSGSIVTKPELYYIVKTV